MSKAGTVALLCSAAALAAVMALTGFDNDASRASNSATAISGGDPRGGGAAGASDSAGGDNAGGAATSAAPAGGSSTASTPATLTSGAPDSSTGTDDPSASTVDGPGPAGTNPATGTQPVSPGPTGLTDQAGLQTSRCADPTGDQSAEGVGDVDLVEVTLRRNSTGLTVRFGLSGAISNPAGSATPAMSSWQILMAEGDDVVYAFTVSNVEGAWETSLVDFASPDGDRFGAMAPASGQAIEVFIPDADLGRLPDRFTWWATSLTDRLVSQGLFANDDCPAGSGVTEAGLSLPPVSRRASFG